MQLLVAAARTTIVAVAAAVVFVIDAVVAPIDLTGPGCWQGDCMNFFLLAGEWPANSKTHNVRVCLYRSCMSVIESDAKCI